MRSLIVSLLTVTMTAMAVAGEATPTTEELDQRLKILERKREIEQEAAAQKEKDTAKLSVGSSGFTLTSADNNYVLKIRGYVHADARVWGRDVKTTTTDTFLLRRVRPILEGSLGKLVDFRVMPDFGGGTTVLQDAYADVKFAPWLKLRAGKFKPPVGLERLQSATDLAFVERALPTNLVPNRDLGIQLFGDALEGVFAYQVAVLNGVADGANSDSELNDNKDVAARLWLTPFKRNTSSPLKDLSFGVVASTGNTLGTLSSTGLAGYRTAGQLTFFSYRSGRTLADTVIAQGERKRLGFQGAFQYRRVAAQAEWYSSETEVLRGETLASLEHTASQATVQIALTRDNAVLKGANPKRPFDPAARQFGGVELVVRAGQLKIDPDAFPIFADPATQPRQAQELGAGVNWYLTRNLKISVDGVRTEFKAVGDAVPRETERVLLSRVQVAF